MASMVAKACCSNSGHPMSVQSKGSRNKRKFRADPPLVDANKLISLPQNECSTYEFSTEKFDIIPTNEPHSVCDLCSTCQEQSEVGSSRPRVALAKPDEFHDADWSDLTESQLEELVLCNLDTIFNSAIKKIVACGYTEEVVTKAILRSGVCYGCKDTVSNVVDNTLSFLKNGQEVDLSREQCFEDLHQMEKYVLAELVCVLRVVRPFFSTGDAMWCLLICDMNVSLACSIDSDPTNNLALNSPVSDPRTNAKNPENLPTPSKPNHSISSPCAHGSQVKESPSSAPDVVDKSFSLEGKSLSPDREGKFTGNKKISGVTKREYILRQKSLRFEKSYRSYSSKGANRSAKLGCFGGLMLDKKLKSVSDSGIGVKNTSLKISKAIGVDLPQENLLNNSSTNIELPSPTIDNDTKLSLSLRSISNPISPSFSYGGFSFDKSLGKWVPQDNKDEMILKLVPRLRDLHSQLQEWTEWANQKVMQAARRLSKDRAELKMLRLEKDEVGWLKKEKQMLEESNMNKLFEMEDSLCKASGEMEEANGNVRRLEAENVALRREMEAAKLRAVESAASCHEVEKREKRMMMKMGMWEKEKVLFQEQLVAEKRKLAQAKQELEQAKDVRDQLEARWKQDEKAKEELLTQSTSLKKEREHIEATAQLKEEMVKQKAEKNLLRYKDDIEKLEKEIFPLRSKTDFSKIAALRRGVLTDSRTVPTTLKEGGPQGPYNTSRTVPDFEDLKRERECVMCLSEEMSVVFLPCAHQVVCSTCNEMHEKQGMKECPSCRGPIKRRISVRYA